MAELIFNGQNTTSYKFDEISGPPQDSIQSHHILTLNGGTYNGDSLTMDGVNDDFRSETLGGTNGPWINPTTDYTIWGVQKVLSAIGAVNERWMRPITLSATKQGPLVSPLFGVGIGKVYFEAHAAGSQAQVILDSARDFNVNEEVLWMMSQDFSTKTINCALYSKDGLELSGTNTGTVDPGFAAADSYLFFNNTAGAFSHVECLEFGAIDGTYKTLSELTDAASAWKAGTSSRRPTLIIIGAGAPRTR